jgi:transposase
MLRLDRRAAAYYLKVELSQIWKQSRKAIAAKFLIDWCGRARASGIKVLITMAKTLTGHCNGILSWYDYPISTGPLEGINTKIGALQRMVYGYKELNCYVRKNMPCTES